jgi:FKBP-type peptidyl-prolyl cis-trans isomerase
MKLNRVVVLACCLVIGVACVWAAQTAPTSTPAPTSAAAPAPASAPAPANIEFKNDQEKLSYAIGCRIGTSLKTRSTAPNLPMLIQGLTQTLNGQPTDEEKLSYAIGCQIGADLKAQETPMDLPMLTQAITQVLNKQVPSLTDAQIGEAINAWQKDVQAKAEKKRQEQAAQAEKIRQEQGQKNLVEGKAFLDANAKKEGVKVLADGLQYKVIKDGTGNLPTATDRVQVNYKGTFTDGTEFDSSYKRGKPAEFQVGGVPKGWTEALQLMKEGSKWEVYIPANLAYAEAGQGPIPPNTVLVFEVELLEIVKPAPGAAAPAPGATITIPPKPAPKPGN